MCAWCERGRSIVLFVCGFVSETIKERDERFVEQMPNVLTVEKMITISSNRLMIHL